MNVPVDPEFMAEHRLAGWLLPQLVKRAQGTGCLGPDFVHHDVALLLLAITGIVAATRESAPEAWRRIAELSIETLRAELEQLPPAPSTQQRYLALAIERIQGRQPENRNRSH